jgi:hypothetical protein
MQMLRQTLSKIPKEYRQSFLQVAKDFAAGDKKALGKFRWFPVDPRTFVEDEYYLNKKNVLYPDVMKAFIEFNLGEYDEGVLTGGIGSGKSTLGLYTTAYQLYLLSCYANPQGYFDLDPSAALVMVFQSLNATKAEELDYDRFHNMLAGSPYFKERFPNNPHITSQLEFPNRIIVKPVSGLETATIGEDVIGGMLDEVNFMAVIEKSKQADGGVYDQANALYNSIARRRESRFMSGGKLPGRLCLVSSRRTPGQFTDKKEEEAKTNPRIYVYDKRVWDIKPGKFSPARFRVFLGDEGRQPRILRDDEDPKEDERDRIDHIPVEFKGQFVDDITKAIRDIAGKSTQAIHPYLPRRDAVLANFGRRRNLFALDCIDFQTTKAKILPKLIKNPQFPRFCHIDLGVTSDHAGITIGHVPRFIDMDRGQGMIERLPECEMDGILEVEPPKGGEIDFASIRRILYKLRDMGLPIRWVSLDSFQSVDTMQILKGQGFVVGYVSLDTSMIPYDLTKQALYDRRIVAPKHPKLIKELGSLERDFKKGKVDHPPRGSKDVADAFAGVVFGLTTRREIWAQHSVPIIQAVSVSNVIRDQESERAA